MRSAALERIGRRGDAAPDVAAGWLGLAAAPTFAAMAVLEAAAGMDSMGTRCTMATHASPLTGMAVMYLLMSLFHVAPWVRRVRDFVMRLHAVRMARAPSGQIRLPPVT